MCKARFTEHQIIAVIKSVEAGRDVEDVGREAGISEANIIVRFRLCRRNLSEPPRESWRLNFLRKR